MDNKTSEIPSQPRFPLSIELIRLSLLCKQENITFSKLFRALRTRGHALITLFLSFPFLLPIPLPGLSTLFGIIIIICGIRISFQWRPWIPRKWRRRKIPGNVLSKVFLAGEKIMRFLEKFIRPRGVKFSSHPETVRACGWMIAAAGLLLSLPYPPGTNSPPASTILLLSIGLLEVDALFIALGIVTFIFNLLLFSAITFYGFEGVKKILEYFY